MLLQTCQPLSHSELEDIIDTACQILAESGCIFESPSAREALLAIGADANKKDNRIRIATNTITEIIETLRQTYHTSLDPSLVMGYATQTIHDPITKQKREGTWNDCEKILTLGQELPQIAMVSWGIQNFSAGSDDSSLTNALRYTTKPIYLGLANSDTAKLMVEGAQRLVGTEAKLKKEIHIAGGVCPSTAFSYHTSDTDLIWLYSQYNQPIYWYSQYHSGLSYPLASVLALQTAEILAGICYAVSIKSKSPFLLCPADPQNSLLDLDTSAVWNFLLYQLASVQIGHYLGLPVAVGAITPNSPDFAHSTIMVLSRQLMWLSGADQILNIGVAGCDEKQSFMPLAVVFDNEWREYWKHIVQSDIMKTKSYPISQFLQESQQGKFSQKLALWNSEFFCTDEIELWRKYRMSWIQNISTQFAQRWQNLEPLIVTK